MNEGSMKEWLTPIIAVVAAIMVGGGIFLAARPNITIHAPSATKHTPVQPATQTSVVDQGTSMDGRPAPAFKLMDQYGKPISLSQYKGKVVVLAFADSECTTICPLTTESMMRALQMLGPAASKDVQLLGINANPQATTIADVKKYSEEHNMMNSWHFLTGSVSQLESIWKKYYIYDQIVNGQIDHTPALYIIGPSGKEQYLFLTPPQYAAVDAQASVLADQVNKFLPASLKVNLKTVTYHTPTLSPKQTVVLPLATGSGTVPIGPGHPQLLVYFASWAPNVKQDLESLDTYAGQKGAPEVVGIDVLPTEPGNKPDVSLLKNVHPQHFKVASDATGDLTDAYQVTDLMWIALTDGHGHVIWSHDGWVPQSTLTAKVKAALGKVSGS